MEVGAATQRCVCFIIIILVFLSHNFYWFTLNVIMYVGLYLTGGLTPKNMSLLQDPHGAFNFALHDKVGTTKVLL